MLRSARKVLNSILNRQRRTGSWGPSLRNHGVFQIAVSGWLFLNVSAAWQRIVPDLTTYKQPLITAEPDLPGFNLEAFVRKGWGSG